MSLSDPITRATFAEICGAPTDATVPCGISPLVYIQTHELEKHLEEIAGRGPCVLVTHASDMTATPAMLAKLPPNVLHWFTDNCGIVSNRVTALPIGLKSNHPDDAAIRPMRDAMEIVEPSGLAYVCLRHRSLPAGPAQERQSLYGMPWAWATKQADASPEQFYRGIRSHAYTICPRGAGPDTHRFWEALYLGSIPVVRRCTAMEHFAGPCLMVHAWEQITERMLIDNLPRLRDEAKAAREKLTASYWRDLVQCTTSSLLAQV